MEEQRWRLLVPDDERLRGRYRGELTGEAGEEVVERWRGAAARGQLVLLTATRDVQHSAAAVLRAVVEGDGG